MEDDVHRVYHPEAASEILKILMKDIQDTEGFYLRRYYPLGFTFEQILDIEEHTWENKPTISTIRRFHV